MKRVYPHTRTRRSAFGSENQNRSSFGVGVYLDYAATTPVDPRVLKAMLPYFGGASSLSPKTYNLSSDLWGNPGSLHSFGQEASAAIFKARQTLAKALHCHYQEIIFTGSATEANNLALRGVLKGFRGQGTGFSNSKLYPAPLTLHPRVIISAIEHESILETARDLEKDGVDVVIVPVDKKGIIDLKKLKAALNERTVLVSVMYANNETGVIQPIAEISKIVRDFRSTKHEARNPKQIKNLNIKNSKLISNFDIRISDLATYPLLHTDASQALQYLSCDTQELGVDLLTISSQKIYGPKGVGALYVKGFREQGTGFSNSKLYPAPLTLHPILTGGGQEQGLRSGTENVPAIVGFAKAVELVEVVREKEVARVHELRDYAWRGIKKIFPKAVLNGPTITYNLSPITLSNRLPNNLNFYIPGISGEQTLVALDLAGIAISSGSACTARSIDPSHVLLAMGFSKERAKNSLRITLGRPTTQHEIDIVLNELTKLKKK